MYVAKETKKLMEEKQIYGYYLIDTNLEKLGKILDAMRIS